MTINANENSKNVDYYLLKIEQKDIQNMQLQELKSLKLKLIGLFFCFEF